MARKRVKIFKELKEALAGINFLASRRLKVYIYLRPTERNFFSERAIGSQPILSGS